MMRRRSESRLWETLLKNPGLMGWGWGLVKIRRVTKAPCDTQGENSTNGVRRTQ